MFELPIEVSIRTVRMPYTATILVAPNGLVEHLGNSLYESESEAKQSHEMWLRIFQLRGAKATLDESKEIQLAEFINGKETKPNFNLFFSATSVFDKDTLNMAADGAFTQWRIITDRFYSTDISDGSSLTSAYYSTSINGIDGAEMSAKLRIKAIGHIETINFYRQNGTTLV
jgi:hypothetical protein